MRKSERSAPGHAPPLLVGQSPALRTLRADLEKVASADQPVLMVGARGAGKTLALNLLHALGDRPTAPLLELDCRRAALLEARLFGVAPANAPLEDKPTAPLCRVVNGGMLILDEVGRVPLALQDQLVELAERRTFRPLGSFVAETFTGRLCATTSIDLERAVEEGRMRGNLLYRLNALEVRIPALEERRGDIPTLVEHFAAMLPRRLRFTDDALALLRSRRWPGNVRELRQVVHALAETGTELVTPDAIRALLGGDAITKRTARLRNLARRLLGQPGGDKLRGVEQALVDEALALSGGNKAMAARLLGVNRKAVERRSQAARWQ